MEKKSVELVLETNITRIGKTYYILIPKKYAELLKKEGIDLDKIADEKLRLLVKLKLTPATIWNERLW